MKIRIFSLIVLVLALVFACESGTGTSPASNPGVTKVALSGKEVYSTYCVACHGANGKMAFSGATDLSASRLDLDTRILQITYGKGVMNAFKNIISVQEIKNVAIYIEDLRVE